MEAGALAGQLLVEHGVVGASQRHRPFRVAQEGQAEPQRGIEYGHGHAAGVEGFRPRLAVARPVALGSHEPAIPSILGKEGREKRTLAIGLVEMAGDLLPRLGHVPVGVDDLEAHGPSPPWMRRRLSMRARARARASSGTVCRRG